MRWFWFDRYTEFISGSRATAVKNVSLAEDHLHDHFPGVPLMPSSLVIEGLAQTAGLLVCEHYDFEERVILAKLAKCVIHEHAVPGDTLTYRAVIEQINKEGAAVSVTSHIGERLQAEASIFFAHLDDRSEGKQLYDPADLLQWLKVVRVFDVGVKPDGSPVRVPPKLAAAAEAALVSDALAE
jgi:3-hydroxyacyl-[acyl-carrier-protein] dehydratase